MSVFKWLACC